MNPIPDRFPHPNRLSTAFSAAVRLPDNHQTIISRMGEGIRSETNKQYNFRIFAL
jgi:hypothetical protein